MKHFVSVSALLVLLGFPVRLETSAVGTLAAHMARQTTAPSGAQTSARTVNPQQALVETYCISCHSTRAPMGGLTLEGVDPQAAAANAEIWEKALRKLRGNQMPPPGSPQPPRKDVESFVAWMETALDTSPRGPRAGYVPIQRLNRTEYAASVKALVGVDVNPKDVLPQDIQVEGFDNIADALSVSPAFLDQYVTAARHVAQLAVGNPTPRVSSVKYPIEANQNPDDPPPPGTWGGVKFKHSFAADGEYQVTLTNLAVGPYSNALEREHTLVILIDGRTVFRRSIGGAADLALVDRTAGTGRSQIMERFSKIPLQVKAGVHEVVVAFVDRPQVETSENLARLQPYAGLTGGAAPTDRRPHLLDGVVVAGPFNPAGVSMTPSRALIFVCDPAKGGEPACARQITERLARRAFRRPATAEDVNRLLPFYESERRNGATFDQGIEQVVAAVLVSPHFLYRGILGAGETTSGGERALTNIELASRLSFFLWNTGPDEELLSLASSNGLTRPGMMERQARRMLADPRASSLVTSFAMKWLNLTTLDQVVPDPTLFPAFNETLRRDFTTEVQSFIGTVFSEDRSVLELLTADYTFLNDRLARHYGISGVTGPQFRRVSLTDATRFGLLGKAAVQLRTSYGDRTSPVLRGAWVLEKLLGTPPTPPPPDTSTDLSQKAGEQPRTVRARLEQHRDKAACRMCHGVIDPTGLALENFDAIGQWRTSDSEANTAIDARTVLPTGVAINGVADLRAQLAARPEVFARTVTERLLMYAVNRRLEYFDMPQVRGIVRSAARSNYALSSLVVGIVNSDAFRRQGAEVTKGPK
jgi:mono/diheme cytochrome c family protein